MVKRNCSFIINTCLGVFKHNHAENNNNLFNLRSMFKKYTYTTSTDILRMRLYMING